MTEGTASQPMPCVMVSAPVLMVRTRLRACAVSTPQSHAPLHPHNHLDSLAVPWNILRYHLHVLTPVVKWYLNPDLLLHT